MHHAYSCSLIFANMVFLSKTFGFFSWQNHQKMVCEYHFLFPSMEQITNFRFHLKPSVLIHNPTNSSWCCGLAPVCMSWKLLQVPRSDSVLLHGSQHALFLIPLGPMEEAIRNQKLKFTWHLWRYHKIPKWLRVGQWGLSLIHTDHGCG